jgi:hypothetical protein
MAPPSADFEVAQPASPIPTKARTISEIKKSVAGLTQSASFPAPLEYSGTLDHYESFDVTSVIGREFPKVQLTDILSDDAKIRDLAITGMPKPIILHFIMRRGWNINITTVSQRGVVFFRNQSIGIEDQKVLGQKLGELTGKPASSKVSKISNTWFSRS